MVNRSTKQTKVIRLMLIWLGISLLGTALYLTGSFASADRLALDQKFLLFQREYEQDDIALIAIDASSLDRFTQQFNLHWPWPRELYGLLVEYLDQAGAKSITFDMLFDRPDIDRLDTEGPVSDRRFAEAVYNSGNVIVAANSIGTMPEGDSADEKSTESTRPSGFDRHLLRADLSPDHFYEPMPLVEPVNLPITPLLHAAHRVGNAYVPTRHDGVIRFTYMMLPVSGIPDESRFFPSLPFAAFLDSVSDTLSGANDSKDNVIHFTNNRLEINNRRIPLQSDGTYRINWYSRGGVNDGTFPYHSFYDVFRSALAVTQNRPDRAPLDDSLFRDRHIVIGASAAGLADIKTTPFSAIEPYPGMEIQATILANLLDGRFTGEISDRLVIILLWILLLPVIIGIGSLRHINSIILAVCIPLAIVTVGISAFGLFRFILPTVFFTGVTTLGIGTTYIYRYVTEERQKKVMKSAFSQYVQKEFVDRIAEDPAQLKLGGQKKELTVLFSDMANFTSISEKLSPEDLSELLNRYLTDMTKIVFDHGGTLDKFIGDAVMAFWGAPIDQPDHAVRACRCALDMQKRLEEHAAEWEKLGYPPVHIRIGINTGPMIVGNMGSKDRFNYTVLGDAVNLGARLEPLNKQYDTNIMISEFTLRSIREAGKTTGVTVDPQVRELDRITVKGKTEAITVYELKAI